MEINTSSVSAVVSLSSVSAASRAREERAAVERNQQSEDRQASVSVKLSEQARELSKSELANQGDKVSESKEARSTEARESAAAQAQENKVQAQAEANKRSNELATSRAETYAQIAKAS